MDTIKKPLHYLVYKLFEYKSSSVIKFVDFHFQGKTRNTGEGLFQHSLRMFKNCLSSGVYDNVILDTILLHDIVEDAQVSRKDIHNAYGQQVADLVSAMTSTYQNGDKIPKDKYFDFFENKCQSNWRLLFVKLYDCIDNLETIDGLRPEKKQRFIDEKRNVYLRIFKKYSSYIPYEYQSIYNDRLNYLEELLA